MVRNAIIFAFSATLLLGLAFFAGCNDKNSSGSGNKTDTQQPTGHEGHEGHSH